MAIFARNPLRVTVLFLLFALYNFGESVEKSKFGCLVCKKTESQLRPFQKVKAYTNDLESCFGIRAAIDDDKLITCEACRRALQESRRTGKSFHHVSAVSSHLNILSFLTCKRFSHDMASPSRAVVLAALT